MFIVLTKLRWWVRNYNIDIENNIYLVSGLQLNLVI